METYHQPLSETIFNETMDYDFGLPGAVEKRFCKA